MTEGSEFEPGRVKNFHFCISSRPTQPPVQFVPGALSPGVKLQEQGRALTTHLQRNVDLCIDPPPYVVMAQCLVS
jgi:hypothetical protein